MVRVHLFLECACGARWSLTVEPHLAVETIAEAGWVLPSMAEEAAGARARCPECRAKKEGS